MTKRWRKGTKARTQQYEILMAKRRDRDGTVVSEDGYDGGGGGGGVSGDDNSSDEKSK